MTGGAAPIFWFIIFIIQAYALYPCLIKFISSHHFKNNTLEFLIYILLIHLCLNTFRVQLLGWISETTYRFILRQFLSNLLYFVLGIYIRNISNNFSVIKDKLEELKFIYLLLFIIPFVVSELFLSHYTFPLYLKGLQIFLQPFLYWLFRTFFTIASIISFFKISIILVRRKNHLKNLLVFIGNYSFGIYLIHFLLIYELKAIFYGFNKSYGYRLEYYLLAFVSTIFFSIVFSKLITFIPYGNYVLGKKT
jgi:peptidoglycan/LPS O-acetylase OafA/YrhL